MQVIAKTMVYYDHRRIKEGEQFELIDREHYIKGVKHVLKAEDQFSAKSMRKFGEEDSEPKAKLGKNEVNIPGYRQAGKGTKIKAKNINPQD